MFSLNLESDPLGEMSVSGGGAEGVAGIQGKPQAREEGRLLQPGGGPEHSTASPVPGLSRGDNDVKASRGPGVRPRARLMDGLIRWRVMSSVRCLCGHDSAGVGCPRGPA